MTGREDKQGIKESPEDKLRNSIWDQ